MGKIIHSWDFFNKRHAADEAEKARLQMVLAEAQNNIRKQEALIRNLREMQEAEVQKLTFFLHQAEAKIAALSQNIYEISDFDFRKGTWMSV